MHNGTIAKWVLPSDPWSNGSRRVLKGIRSSYTSAQPAASGSFGHLAICNPFENSRICLQIAPHQKIERKPHSHRTYSKDLGLLPSRKPTTRTRATWKLRFQGPSNLEQPWHIERAEHLILTVACCRKQTTCCLDPIFSHTIWWFLVNWKDEFRSSPEWGNAKIYTESASAMTYETTMPPEIYASIT